MRRESAVRPAIVLTTLVAVVLCAPWFGIADPLANDLAARLDAPSWQHLLGRDPLGRDVLARLLYGARTSLAVGGATVAVSLALGVVTGSVAGWRGGWVDEALVRLVDILLAFPGLLLAIAFAAMRGPSVFNVIVALSLLGWTGYARLARAEVRRGRERDFVTAARALGAPAWWQLGYHVLPAAAPALLVQATFGLSSAIIAEASLSFLGVGTPAPAPSWGGMLDEARPFLLVAPHLTLAPGIALAATVLAIQAFGDRLRTAFGDDPERAQR